MASKLQEALKKIDLSNLGIDALNQVLEAIVTSGQTSKLLWWELENFGSYPYQRFDFKDSNVMVFKALNSSGKSMAIRGLRAALTNAWVTQSRVKRLIRQGEVDACVRLMFDDGVEIEYILHRSSLESSSRFYNGYHLYVHVAGKRYLLYTTKQGERYLIVRDQPDIIKRYLNLAELDKGYLNVMKKDEGLLILEQTPKKLMSTLAKVTDLETSEQAMKKIKADNKDTMSDLLGADSRIALYSQEIKARKHLTEAVMGILTDLDDTYTSTEEAEKTLNQVRERFEDLNNLPIAVGVSAVNSGDLQLLNHLEGILKDLSELKTIPKLDSISDSGLSYLNAISAYLKSLTKLAKNTSRIEGIETTKLDVLKGIENKFKDLERLKITEYPKLGSVSVETLNVLNSLRTALNNTSKLEKHVSDLETLVSGSVKDVQTNLEKLKSLGYPVSRCSSCGQLAFMEEFTVEGIGKVPAHTHEGV